MLNLNTRTMPGTQVVELQPGSWRLSLPASNTGDYCMAQMDDYLHRSRSQFLWNPPISFSLAARVSAPIISGTWGFGLWNDPFSASLGLGGMPRRVPALPNTAWFFFASPPNYLALQDDHPAQGMLAATFSAPHLSPWLLALGAPWLPLLPVPFFARLMRRAARHLIKESANRLDLDVTAWHTYRLDWLPGEAGFTVDGKSLFSTPISPLAPLGLVVWIDNQYAAFTPDGKFKTGSLANPEAVWLEIQDIELS